jgi:hypothetical protein
MKIALCVGEGRNYGPGWIGYDVKDFGFRPLVLQDVRTVDGRRFRRAELIFATPPCGSFSTVNRKADGSGLDVVQACFRIGREAGVPFILENVAGAQRWLGSSTAHRGPWHFWGDVGLLPLGTWRKGKWSGRNQRRDPGRVPKELVP